MTSSCHGADATITVVVVDNASSADAARALHQLVKTASRDTELVLASLRAHRLPGSLGRKVRKLRAAGAEMLDAAIADIATTSGLVVVAPSSSSFSRGWEEEVRSRVALYPRVISHVDSAFGGILVYPKAVVTTDVQIAPWLSTQALSVRAGAEQGAARSVSAVMIVKNEEDVLDECLTALAAFVDEIVVYDTGSTDATMDIARRHGVVLIEGYWDDHFGNARNQALEHATGDWIFQVDADEVVTGSSAEFRARLNVETANQILVGIVSSAWKGVTTGAETYPVRLFQRESSTWVGALHEYPRPLDGSDPTISSTPAPIRLLHSGYELGKVQDRDKTTRNVDMARRELAEAGAESPMKTELLSNLARSLMWAGRVEEAINVFAELRVTPGNPSAVVMSGRPAVGVMVGANRLDEADAWLDTLAANGESPGNLAVLRARRLLAVNDIESAATTIAPFQAGRSGGVDTWGIPFDPLETTVVAAEIELARGEVKAAVNSFLTLVDKAPDLINLTVVLPALLNAGRSVTDLVEHAPESLLARSLREASMYHPSGALLWFDAFHATHPQDYRPVVAGNMFASRSGWHTALIWSLRARELGLAREEVCALRGLGERESAPMLDRCVSWALLAEVFGDQSAGAQFESLTQCLSVVESETLIGTLAELGIDVCAPSSDTITMPFDTSVSGNVSAGTVS